MWWTSSCPKKVAICLWWSKPMFGSSSVWRRPTAVGPKSPSASSSSAASPVDTHLCRRTTSSWLRKQWTPAAAAGTPSRCLRRSRRCWRAQTAPLWVSEYPARSVQMLAPHLSWSLAGQRRRHAATNVNNHTVHSSWLCCVRRTAATHGGAGSAAWSVTEKFVSAANGSFMSTSKTSAGATGLLRLPVTTPTTVRATAHPMWRASAGPRCPSTPPLSVTTAWGATARSRTCGPAACRRGYAPCPCCTTTRSRRSSRRTSRTWSWRSAAAHKHETWNGSACNELDLRGPEGSSEPRETQRGDHCPFYFLRVSLYIPPSLHVFTSSSSRIQSLSSLDGTFRQNEKIKSNIFLLQAEDLDVFMWRDVQISKLCNLFLFVYFYQTNEERRLLFWKFVCVCLCVCWDTWKNHIGPLLEPNIVMLSWLPCCC